MTAGTAAGVTILVVDDHPVVRRGLRALLSAEDWVTEVLEAGTAAEARRLATTHQPAVAVVDLALPDGDGIELITRLGVVAPDCATVVVTMTHDPGTVRAALAAGGRGYLLKDSAPELLVAAVRTVAAGGRALGAHVETEPGAGPRAGRRPSPVDRLSPRERRVLELLARGRSNGEIARELSLSEKTVRNQVSIVVGKLGVADRVQAVLLAQRHGTG